MFTRPGIQNTTGPPVIDRKVGNLENILEKQLVDLLTETRISSYNVNPGLNHCCFFFRGYPPKSNFIWSSNDTLPIIFECITSQSWLDRGQMCRGLREKFIQALQLQLSLKRTNADGNIQQVAGRMSSMRGSPRRSSVEGERKLWLHSAGRFLRWNLLHAPRSPWGHWGGSTTQYCRPRGFERGSAGAIESNCMPLPAFRDSRGKYTDNLW